MLPIYKDENKQKEASIWPYFEYLVKYLSLILSQVACLCHLDQIWIVMMMMMNQ